jgi:hypothetical protein
MKYCSEQREKNNNYMLHTTPIIIIVTSTPCKQTCTYEKKYTFACTEYYMMVYLIPDLLLEI